MREAYDNHPNKTIATKVNIEVTLIPILNNFVFNSIIHLKIVRCAKGTICAPAYAIIFMVKFKKEHIYPYIKNKSMLYSRYIDDILMIWTETKQELLIFLEKLNSKNKTIKFEHNISYSDILFLDTLIYKDKNNTLQTTLYRKPTEQQSNIHAYSDRPKSLKISIPYSQALRIKIICSTVAKYKKHNALLKQNFIETGYEKNVLKDEIDKVDNINRKDLIRKKKKILKKKFLV